MAQERWDKATVWHFADGKQVGQWITCDKHGQKYKVAQIKPKPGKA